MSLTLNGTPDPNAPKVSPRLQAMLEENKGIIAAFEAKVAPLRERIAAIRDNIAPQLAEINQLEDQITALDSAGEQMQIRELKQETAKLERVLAPPTFSLPAEPSSTSVEGQK